MPRLSITTLPSQFADGVIGPAVDPAVLSIGIVHFGVGAFHRSHQAVFTEDAAAITGDTQWGILGVTGRTENVVRQLRPQDGLFGVLQKGVSQTSLRIIGSIREVASAAQDSERVLEAMASPNTRIASLTITEKGYLRASNGAINTALSVVKHDLALIASELRGDHVAEPTHTAIGLLVQGLARRYRLGGQPLTVLSCDNVVHNGVMVKMVVLSMADFAGGDDRGWVEWLERAVSYPSTMVDRITPATSSADREEAFGLLGLVDEGLVVAEPFSQWVIEDDFAHSRPAWELSGAIMTDDVMPFERAKLRILNATHSLLAYLGQLCGYATIAETVADNRIRETAMRMLDHDVLPTLDDLPGLKLSEYRDSVIERFANPALSHLTLQVAMDGSQKLPDRLLGTALDRLAAGVVPLRLALAVASWIAFIAFTMQPGGPKLDDPMANELTAALGSADSLEREPELVVDRLFTLRKIFPPALASSPEFRDAVITQLPVVRNLATSAP